MRPLDWVDRLAGVGNLEPHAWFDSTLTPQGKWLTWPAWRRLADLVRARVQGRVMFWYFMMRLGENRWAADAAFGIYDIHLSYLFESAR
jgi:hypothetical protein